jgi:hypothetical protein
MIVTETQNGYLGSYRKPGDVFEIEEHQFADRWMSKGSTVVKRAVPSDAQRARQEALAAGGPSAALTTALADLREAGEREAALLARIAELEAALGTVATTQVAAEAENPAEAAGDEQTAASSTEEPPATAPVQRVRRTPVAR